MSDLLIKAIVTGLILSVMLGPAFFILLETSIKKGVRAALSFDAGVFISDVIYIIIAYVFIQQVGELSKGGDNALIRAFGGVLFLVYGYITFIKKIGKIEVNKIKDHNTDPKDYWILFLKGLFLNFANPLVIFYWFSVMALGHSGNNNPLSGFEMFIYLSMILFTFFTIDILKIFGAKRLRPFITVGLLRSLNRITGSILMSFGIFLVINSIVIWIR